MNSLEEKRRRSVLSIWRREIGESSLWLDEKKGEAALSASDE